MCLRLDFRYQGICNLTPQQFPAVQTQSEQDTKIQIYWEAMGGKNLLLLLAQDSCKHNLKWLWDWLGLILSSTVPYKKKSNHKELCCINVKARAEIPSLTCSIVCGYSRGFKRWVFPHAPQHPRTTERIKNEVSALTWNLVAFVVLCQASNTNLRMSMVKLW